MAKNKTKRLFLALNMPASLKTKMGTALMPLRKQNKQIKWLEPTNYHITLHFIGDATEQQTEELRLTLSEYSASIGKAKFALGLIDALPNRYNPKVVFWQAKELENSSVYSLQIKLGSCLKRLGFQTDSRKWLPHITLGRVKNTFEGQIGDNSDIHNLFNESFNVESFDLMESILKKNGSEYKLIKQYEL